ncbi:hypothetical protein E4U54_006929 [Claviceps lovelessii]|nr:hypothetical protein E4U54_006929 [Claviceps lovelessii]
MHRQTPPHMTIKRLLERTKHSAEVEASNSHGPLHSFGANPRPEDRATDAYEPGGSLATRVAEPTSQPWIDTSRRPRRGGNHKIVATPSQNQNRLPCLRPLAQGDGQDVSRACCHVLSREMSAACEHAGMPPARQAKDQTHRHQLASQTRPHFKTGKVGHWGRKHVGPRALKY